MFIEYITIDDRKVLHQMRAVEECAEKEEAMEKAVERLKATGFRHMDGRTGNREWTNGSTDAYIHDGSLEDARATITRDVHVYSYLD